MAEAPIQVQKLSKRFRIYHQRSETLKQALVDRRRSRYEEFWAVKDADFQVAEGETFGIIGANGSGKSTLLKCVAGILVPDRGRVTVRGRLASLLEVGAGFHPDYSGRENIFLNGAILGLPRRYINSVLDEIVAFAELEQFIDNPVRNYSSGMYTRLGFSIAIHMDPDILLIDEVLAVGDEAFQRRCMDHIEDMRREGRTLIFVSHAADTVRKLCHRCLWLEAGAERMLGPTDAVVDGYIEEVNRREMAALQQAAEATSGPGWMGVRITSLRVLGPDGQEGLTGTGEPLLVRIGYEAPAGGLNRARFRVSFHPADGPELVSVQTDDRDLGERSLPGSGEVSLTIPELPFLDGVYGTKVEIEDIASGRPYVSLDRPQSFRVHGPGRREQGLALVGHRWELPVSDPSAVSA
ncbi:MAG: ABC transporter ATP-binding protein [Candidatus Dormiibacterota bacterium]